MKPDYVFTSEAVEDLISIWKFIADNGSESTADRAIRKIYAQCQKLADMPGMGHFRHDLLDKRHRFWRVYSYLIAYRWDEKPIKILAVVHGARDLDAFFATRPADDE